MSHRNRFVPLLLIALLIFSATVTPMSSAAAVPDPVLQWIGVMNDTVLAGGTSPLATTRVVALVSASVYASVLESTMVL
jgi:hypothetical protein